MHSHIQRYNLYRPIATHKCGSVCQRVVCSIRALVLRDIRPVEIQVAKRRTSKHLADFIGQALAWELYDLLRSL